MDIDDDVDENYEFVEVMDSIVERGRFNETLLLLREVDGAYEIAVPSDIRPFWTVNPFAWWCHERNEHPIAYRVDGFHIWPSDSLNRSFIAAVGEVMLEDYYDGVIRFATLEDAMIFADEHAPWGRRVRDPDCVEHGPRYGRLIHFGQPARRSRSAKSQKA